jgi:hypothetical protein
VSVGRRGRHAGVVSAEADSAGARHDHCRREHTVATVNNCRKSGRWHEAPAAIPFQTSHTEFIAWWAEYAREYTPDADAPNKLISTAVISGTLQTQYDSDTILEGTEQRKWHVRDESRRGD